MEPTSGNDAGLVGTFRHVSRNGEACSLVVDLAAGEGGLGQGGLAQRTTAGPFLVAGFGGRKPGKEGGLDRSGNVAEGVGPFPGEVGGVDEPRLFGLVVALDVVERSLGLGDGMCGFAGFTEGCVGPGL